jgi:hypothetical protein
MAGKVPSPVEELRTQTEHHPANDPLGIPQAAAQKIVNRLLESIIGKNQSDVSAGSHFSTKSSAQTDCRIVDPSFEMIQIIADDAIPSAETFGCFDRQNLISAPIEPLNAMAT